MTLYTEWISNYFFNRVTVQPNNLQHFECNQDLFMPIGYQQRYDNFEELFNRGRRFPGKNKSFNTTLK